MSISDGLERIGRIGFVNFKIFIIIFVPCLKKPISPIDFIAEPKYHLFNKIKARWKKSEF
jgi:uncharacterized membrane protein